MKRSRENQMVRKGNVLPEEGAEESAMAGIVPAVPMSVNHPAIDVAAETQPDDAVLASAPVTSRIRSAAPAPPENHPAAKIRPASAATLQAFSAKRDFVAPAGKRMQALYPIQKPPKSKFVRAHASPEYRQFGIWTYTDPDSNEVYYVSPDLEIPESYGVQLKVTDLYAAQTHDGTFFIWFVHRSESTWFRSAKKALQVATKKWTRVIARKGPNTYDLYESEFPIPEPGWGDLPPFAEMLEEAFDDLMIDSLEHPALRKARGLVDDDA
jgi:hypothetical protein